MEFSLERKNKLVEYSLYLACALSNLSQLPIFVRAGITQALAYPGWILLATVLAIFGRLKVRKAFAVQIMLGAIWIFWLLLDSMVLDELQFGSSLVYAYFVSFFVFFLGAGASPFADSRILRNINFIFIITTLLISVDIFIEYFGFGYSLETRQYAYTSKNSASQIISTSILLLIAGHKPKRISGRILRIAAIVFLLYLIVLLRSRATLVGLILCILVILLSRETSLRIRAVILAASLTIVVLLLTSSRFNHFVFDNVLFAGRNAEDLNELTSGRLEIIKSFPHLIAGHYIAGIGPTYFESFPLSALLQFGVFGGGVIILISLQPFLFSTKYKSSSIHWELLFLVSLGFCVNGLFEGLTPFGPGVKCYYMWLLFGILGNRHLAALKKGRYMLHE